MRGFVRGVPGDGGQDPAGEDARVYGACACEGEDLAEAGKGEVDVGVRGEVEDNLAEDGVFCEGFFGRVRDVEGGKGDGRREPGEGMMFGVSKMGSEVWRGSFVGTENTTSGRESTARRI